MNYFLKATQSLSDGDHRESRHSGEEHNGGHKKREGKGETGRREGDTQGRNNQDCLALIDMHVFITLAAGVTPGTEKTSTSVRFSLDNKKTIAQETRGRSLSHPQVPRRRRAAFSGELQSPLCTARGPGAHAGGAREGVPQAP